MTAKHLVLAAALALCATTAMAQSHSALLEQAIFAEDTAGDVDGAIRLYERLLNSQGVPSQLAAAARARLSDAQARRDQRTQLAAHADQSRQVPGQPGRVDPPPSPPAPRAPVATSPVGTSQVGTSQVGTAPTQLNMAITDGCCGWWSNLYDANRPIVVSGTIVEVQWVNPLTVLEVQGSDGKRWGFALNPPNAMIRQGINSNSLKVGDAVTVSGFLALGTSEGCQGHLPHGCATLADGALHASGRIVTSTLDGHRIFSRFLTEEEKKRDEERTEIPALVRMNVRVNGVLPALNFTNASPRDILVTIGKWAGIAVTFNRDYIDPRPYSLEMKDVTLEQALKQITMANQLIYKVIADGSAILVSNDNSQKR